METDSNTYVPRVRVALAVRNHFSRMRSKYAVPFAEHPSIPINYFREIATFHHKQDICFEQ